MGLPFDYGIPLLYLLIGGLWIYFSDMLASSLAGTEEQLRLLSTYKGWFFVWFTATLLFLILKRFVSRIRRAHHDLRENQENLRITLHSIGDAVISTDTKGRIASMNPKAEEMTGWRQPEAAGKPLAEVFHVINEQTRQPVENPVAEVLSTEQPTSLPGQTLLIAKDGRETPITDSAAPIRNTDGKIAGVVLAFRDQTKERATRNALEKSKEEFKSILEDLLVGVIVHAADSSILRSNPQARRILGLSHEQMSGKPAIDPVWHFIHENLSAMKPEEYPVNQVISTGKRIENQILGINRPDCKETTWVSLSAIPVFTEQNVLSRIIVNFMDITGRKEAEKRIQFEQRLFHSLMETLPISVYFKDRESQFVIANPLSAPRLGAKTTEELIGKTDFDFFPEEAARQRYELEQQIMRTEQPTQLEESGFDRWVLTTKAPWYGENGEIAGTFGISMDITDRKQAEKNLRRLSAAIEQSPETIVITDPEGVIQYVNPAFETISGYSPEEALGKNPHMLKSGQHDDAFYSTLWKTIRSGNTWAGRFVNKRKNGELYTEEATIAPVKDSTGIIINYVAIKRDITEELLKEEQFRQSQKMEAVGQLAGGIAHDFNNILQVIAGFSEILLGQLETESLEYQNATEIQKAAKRAAKLTRQMLTFSRKQPASKAQLNLNTTVQDTEVLLKVLLGEKIKLVQNLAPDLLPIFADHGQITQIIMNLAINARDAMPGGGQLTVATENITVDRQTAEAIPEATSGTFVCLSITDAGYGLSREVKDHLFEPFFTTKEVGKGTGLGLSVVYGIVKQSNGWIEVHSEKGTGSTFKIYLPASKTTVPDKPEMTNQTRDPRILLVEDDAEMRTLVIRILKTSGYEIVAVESAADAIQRFEQENGRFDLLFSDMVMPGKSGLELVDELRVKNPELPVLLYSGYQDQRERWEKLESKGYHFLQKPFSTTALLAAVRDALATHLMKGPIHDSHSGD